jgi:photosystem II stability/assembly factor-like uncharacterized protein
MRRLAPLALALTCVVTVAVAAAGNGASAATPPIVSKPVAPPSETAAAVNVAPAETTAGQTPAPPAEDTTTQTTGSVSTATSSSASLAPARSTKSANPQPAVGPEIVVPAPPPQTPHGRTGAGSTSPTGHANGTGQTDGLSPGTGTVAAPQTGPAAFASLEPSLTLPLSQANPLVDFFINTYRTPPFLLPIYIAAAERYDVPWQVLAAINEVESDYGSDVNVSSAGAEGWMQFIPAEWAAYGVDANGAGVRDPYSPADAIFAAARYLAAAGAAHDIRAAIFSYNHSSSYVESVMLRAQLLRETPQSLIGGMTAIVDGRSPVAGSGELARTPVWSSPSTTATIASGHDARTLSAPTGAPAPPPQVAAASGTSSTERAVVGANIATAPGTSVLAVQNAEVLRVGLDAKLGHFIELRDAYGDTYTYAHLGRVLARSALAPPAADGPGSAWSQSAGSPRGRLQWLRSGAWVTAGTALGNVAGAAPGARAHFLLAIAPAGAAAIDPRPILAAWQALGEAQGQPRPDTQPLFGPTAADAVIGEILLMSEQQLEAHLLADPDLSLSTCSRRGIATGQVDRQMLAALDFLVASGLDPTVSTPACRDSAAAAGASVHAGTATVLLSALNGVPVRGHHGPGSLAAQAVRRLLALPGAMRPDRIAAPVGVAVAAAGRVSHGPAGVIEVGFGSQPQTSTAPGSVAGQPGSNAAQHPSVPGAAAARLAAKRAQSAPALDTAQWRKLIDRVSRLPQPLIPSKATSAAVPDTASSPLPTADTELALLAPTIAAPTPATSQPTEGASTGTEISPGTESSQAPEGSPASESSAASEAGGVQLSSPLADTAAPLITVPKFTLEAPSAPSGILSEDEELKVTSDPAVGVQSADFQFKPAESSTWTTIERTSGAVAFFETATLTTPDGLYDLRAVVTAVGGAEYVAELPDLLIDNGEAPVVSLEAQPSSNVRGVIALTARKDSAVNSPYKLKAVNFEYAPSRPGPVRHWVLIEQVIASTKLQAEFATSFDTSRSGTPDGDYDFRVVPEGAVGGATKQFASIPIRNLLLDNTPPTVALSDPGSPLSGVVTLSATAQDPSPGSGVAAVTFERAHAGSEAWQTIGTVSLASPAGSDTYSHRLRTEGLPNGSYDFRATATDVAGNHAASPVVAEVEVQNPVSPPAVSASVTSVVAPAENVTILGTVSAESSSEHETETWAYGTTKAPPADVDGSPLPYTAQGYQLVLLRYTEKDRWQIVEVLREPGGQKPYQLLPADKLDVNANGGVYVSGGVTPSGEAWLWVVQTEATTIARRLAVFHRTPGGAFQYDPAATNTLAPLLNNNAVTSEAELYAQLRVEQNPEGHVFGLLTAGSQVYGYLKDGKWTLQDTPLPPAGVAGAAPMTFRAGDLQGAGELWGTFEVATHTGVGLILGHFYDDAWHFPPHGLGLDALDLTGALAKQPGAFVEPQAVKAEPEGHGVWVEAKVHLPGYEASRVVARYEEGAGGKANSVTSWCSLPVANSCEEALGLATVPDAFFNTPSGQVALALGEGAIHVYSHGIWTRVIAPGYTPEHGESFTAPNSGWLGGTKAVGRWSTGQSSPLTSWPLPDRWPLTSVALPPGSDGLAEQSGALAVGLNGASLHYEAGAGWLVATTPPRARHINLLDVAFAGPSSAFAVGQFGVILRWNGSSWSEDPQSVSLTQAQLNSVAFAPSGEGWAVGADGTILHYNGEHWITEEPPHGDSGEDITSVTVAGNEVFAVAGGNLITLGPGGDWEAVGESLLPTTPRLAAGRLRLVAGLPDGGLIAAGNAVMLVREAAGQSFQYASQPLSGVAVALAPFRESNGDLRAYVSIAPPATANGELSSFPPGDGDLLRQTEGGWQDISGGQFASTGTNGDGELKTDPVLAVATGLSGEHAWAVGGYAGSEDAAGQGVAEVLSARSTGWDTASIWRFDSNETVNPPALTSVTPTPSDKPGTISFAFFTSAMCRTQCSAVTDAQPSVNLKSAAEQIAAYAAQPGGPTFAVLGGDARGPLEGTGQAADEAQQADFAQLPELLAPLGGLPTFAALGHYDHVPGQQGETPWAEAFAGAPQPFGSGADAASIIPDSSGAPTPGGDVNRYYSFTAEQNGAALRVIVLDNSEGSLEASAATTGQLGWLEEQLGVAQAEEVPIVVFAAEPLHEPAPLGRGAADGESVATLLANAGVLAVFTTNPSQLDRHYLIPEYPGEGPQIPEYEGASLGYQQSSNDGVMWYDVTVTSPKQTLKVSAVPVINSLALKPVNGLSVTRSLTLQFEAVGRRPAGTLATRVGENPLFPGYSNYVEIPSSKCSSCVLPSYTFSSSEPTIGTFVEPIAAGSPLPKLEEKGHPIASATSGLFCAYNAGTTTVSVTAGLYSYSLPVTVAPGGVGSPCGTVARVGVGEVIHVRTARTTAPNEGAGVGKLQTSLGNTLPAALLAIPPLPSPAPHVTAHVAAPVATPLPVPPPLENFTSPPTILSAATPPVEPIPPGAGGFAQSPAAAKRREEVRKHASQSAFTLRPVAAIGESGGEAEWFYWAVGAAALLAMGLIARGLPAGPRARPALLLNRSTALARQRADRDHRRSR